MRSDRFVTFGYLAAVVLLIGLGAYSQKNIYQMKTSTERRAAARQSILETERLLSLLKDMETGTRGFVLTGRDYYLEPYNAAAPQLWTAVRRAQASLAGHPTQLARLETVATLARKKRIFLEAVIDARRMGGMRGAVALIQTDVGKFYMDGIRAVMKDIDRDGEAEIHTLSDSVNVMVTHTFFVSILASLAAVLLYSLAVYFLTRNSKRRIAAEREILEANQRIEKQRKKLEVVVAVQNLVVNAGLDSSAVINLILFHSEKLTGAEGSVVELVEGDEMVYLAAGGEAKKFLGMRIKVKGSLSGTCVEEGRSLLCYDTELDERVDREACRKINIRSMLVVPMLQEQRILGVLKVFSSQPKQFCEEDAATLELIAGLLASSYGHAISFEKNEELIGELRATQRQLMDARDRADSATKAKSEFLANMSHEIRTPLNGILGMTGILVDSSLSQEQMDYAKTIQRQGESLLALLNDILDFSKIEAGKLDFERVDFDLVSNLQDLQKTFQYAAKQKGLVLVTDFEPNVPLYVKGDPSRVRQVATNLLGNAIKFTEAGSVVLRMWSVRKESGKARVRFEVKDTGVGIDETAIHRLFQVFSQADASTTRRFGGTGLGLSISKRLVEAMGGEIGVKSEIGVGSTFWFELEFDLGQAVAESGKGEELVAISTPLRVLVAEDNTVNQKIVLKMLEKIGIRADCVSNGKEALDALRERPYDIVLMDCQMPEMDGYEATMRIRLDRSVSNNHVPIIAMTANAMRGDQERCLAAGMDDYIQKPLFPKKLSEMLRKWSDRLRSAA